MPVNPKSLIAVSVYGETTIHFPSPDGNYATLCGLDGNDSHPTVNQTIVKLPNNPKVNCPDCAKIFHLIHNYSITILAEGV